MPLAFESRSHGTVAFGFFNIETDLLLLENLFFFASDLCGLLERLADRQNPAPAKLEGWTISDRQKMGDLHGSIAGYNLSGFIGAVYALHPFPRDREGFKQQPEGDRNRAEVEGLLQEWAEPLSIPLDYAGPEQGIRIGEYIFAPAVFYEIVEYVWRGGMPRWREELRPDYVTRMGRAVTRSGSDLFAGLSLRAVLKRA